MIKVELDKQDVISLIKGTGGPAGYDHPFSFCGEVTGFPNEKWYWNDAYLNSLEDYRLWSLYTDLKAFNKEHGH